MHARRPDLESSPLRFRFASDDDIPALAALYAGSVRALGPSLYTPAQVDAWSASPQDSERFNAWIRSAPTLLLLLDRAIAGFCGVGDDGHVTSLYVAADHTRKGVGSTLLREAMRRARDRGIREFYTEASFFSRPVFARHGFYDDYEETVDYNGTEFRRFVMRHRID